MSLADVEDAVTAPERWLSLVYNSQEMLIPSQTRILELSERVNDPDIYPSLYLVPGGRFLIIFASSLTLFDVSYGYASPRLVAETISPFSDRDLFLVHSSTDGEGIRILVSQSPGSNLDPDDECVF